jgi:hypothetical protein
LLTYDNGSGGKNQIPHETFLDIYSFINRAGADEVRQLPDSKGEGTRWYSLLNSNVERQKYFFETIISGVLSGISIEIIKRRLIDETLQIIRRGGK